MAEEAGSQIGDAFISIGGSRQNLTDALKTATKDVADWVTRSSAALSNIQPRGLGGPGGPGGRGPGGLPMPGAGDGLGGLGRIGQAVTGGAKVFGRAAGKLFLPITGALTAIDFVGAKRDTEQLGIAIGRLGGEAGKSFDKAIATTVKLRGELGGLGRGTPLGTMIPYREMVRAQTIVATAGVEPTEDVMKAIVGNARAFGKSIEESAQAFVAFRQGAGDLKAYAMRLPETAFGPERVQAFMEQGKKIFEIEKERVNSVASLWKRAGIFIKEAGPITIATLENTFHDFYTSGRNLAKAFSEIETAKTGRTPAQRQRYGPFDPGALKPPYLSRSHPGIERQPPPDLNEHTRSMDEASVYELRRRRDIAIDTLGEELAPSMRDDMREYLQRLNDAIARLAEAMENIQGDPVPTAGTPDVETDKNRR